MVKAWGVGANKKNGGPHLKQTATRRHSLNYFSPEKRDDDVVQASVVDQFFEGKPRRGTVLKIDSRFNTSCPHNTKNHITLGEMKRFRKAALGGG
jgi:hypothetical protein